MGFRKPLRDGREQDESRQQQRHEQEMLGEARQAEFALGSSHGALLIHGRLA
jgi:hypothetical protein